MVIYEPDLVNSGLAEGDLVTATFIAAPYATFTVSGKVRHQHGALYVGPWLIQNNVQFQTLRSLGQPASDHQREEGWFGECYHCGANMLEGAGE